MVGQQGLLHAGPFGDQACAGALERPFGEQVEGSGKDPLSCGGRPKCRCARSTTALVTMASTLSSDISTCKKLVRIDKSYSSGSEGTCEGSGKRGVHMFRLVNVGGRPALEHAGGFYDVARLAADDSLATAVSCLARAEELHELARRCAGAEPDGGLDEVVLGPPVPDARQVFGIGLNYKSHAEESGMELPPAPLTFTKFPSCLAGPTTDVPLSAPSLTTRPNSSWSSAGPAATFGRIPPGTWSLA